MKRLLFAPLLVLLVVSCKKADPVVYPDGEVRLQRIKDKEGRVRHEFMYDARGRIVNQKMFFGARKTPSEIKYFYDRSGRLSGTETLSLEYLSCSYCEGPALKFYQVFEYDRRGRLARTKHLNEENKVVSEWTHEYDGDGRLIRYSSFFVSTGRKGRYDVFTYDTRGNITKAETFAADGNLTNRGTYEYDDRPNPYRGLYLGIQAASFRSPNNVVRSKSEFLSPYGGPPSESTTRFEYDPATGYPVRAEYENGTVSIFEYR